MQEFKTSADIIRTAVKMLPVTGYDDLISKLDPYKSASANLITELVRAVNTEGQYHALKTSEFKLSKAAAALQQPFDPAEVLRRMSKYEVGIAKAAQVSGFRFSDIRVSKKKVRKSASVNAMALVRKLAASSNPEDIEKLMVLRQTAAARKEAILSEIRMVAGEIAQVVAAEPVLRRKYAELMKATNVNPEAHRTVSIQGVLKWAMLKDRFDLISDELDIVNETIGG